VAANTASYLPPLLIAASLGLLVVGLSSGAEEQPQGARQDPETVRDSAAQAQQREYGPGAENQAPASEDTPDHRPQTSTTAGDEELFSERDPWTQARGGLNGPSPNQAARRGGSGRVGSAGELQSREAPVRLETLLEGRLLRWRLTNSGHAAVYVFACLSAYDSASGRVVPSRERVYSRVRGTELYLTRRVWRVPGALYAQRYETPYLVRLEQGRSLRGSIELPNHLELDFPYRKFEGPVQHEVRSVSYSMGYAVEGSVPAPMRSAHRGLYTLPYREGITAQQIAHGETLSVSLRASEQP
jgi:hypothetical protein